MVISSGVTAATVGKIDCAMAAVTRPAPARNAATELIEGAPDLPLAPPMTRTCPKRPLLESAGRRRSAIDFGASRPGQAGGGLDCLGRRTDGRHHDRSPGKHSGNMGQLGRGKCDHGVGAVGFAGEEISRVRVPSGRQIHRNHRGSEDSAPAACGQRLPDRASEDENRCPGPRRQRAARPPEGLCSLAGQIGFFLDGDRRHGKPLQHGLWVALHLRGVSEHQHGDGTAGFRQMPRGDQAVTAVVALAAQHHDAPALGQFTQNEAGHGAAGMLHQFERRDAEAVGGHPIGDSHLVSGQYLHS